MDERPVGELGGNVAERTVLVIRGPEKRRHIDAGDTAQGGQQVHPVCPVPGQIRLTDIKDRFLSVAQQERVNARGKRLGVKGARPAGNNQRMGFVPVLRQEGDTAQVQHHQDVGVRQFVLEAEADNVEGRQRGIGLE